MEDGGRCAVRFRVFLRSVHSHSNCATRHDRVRQHIEFESVGATGEQFDILAQVVGGYVYGVGHLGRLGRGTQRLFDLDDPVA